MNSRKELLHFNWQSWLTSKKLIEKIPPRPMVASILMITTQTQVWMNTESGHRRIKVESFSPIQRHQAVFLMKQILFKAEGYLLIGIQGKIIFYRWTIQVGLIGVWVL